MKEKVDLGSQGEERPLDKSLPRREGAKQGQGKYYF